MINKFCTFFRKKYQKIAGWIKNPDHSLINLVKFKTRRPSISSGLLKQ